MSVCSIRTEVTAEYTSDGRSSERRYVVRGPTTRTAAEAEVAASTPSMDGTMVRKGWSLKQTSDKTWEAVVRYSSAPSTEIGDVKISGSTKGGTFKQTHALEHISTTAASGTHPGHAGAINVTKDGIDGVEIPLPTFTFSIQRVFAPGTVTNAYMATLAAATTCVNDDTWYGFAKGEVFLSGIGFELNLETETVTYDFEVSPNQEDITVAGITKNTTPPARPAKEGWDYLWVEYRETSDDATGYAKQTPVALHIERVYEYFDFSLLGI